MALMALTHLLASQEHYQEGIMSFLLQAPSLHDCAHRKSGNKHLFASSSPLQIQDFGTLGQIKTDS